jgi:hypothetical protein
VDYGLAELAGLARAVPGTLTCLLPSSAHRIRVRAATGGSQLTSGVKAMSRTASPAG